MLLWKTYVFLQQICLKQESLKNHKTFTENFKACEIIWEWSKKIKPKFRKKFNGQAKQSYQCSSSVCTDGLMFPNFIFLLLVEVTSRLQ